MEHKNNTNETWNDYPNQSGATNGLKVFTTVAYSVIFPIAVVGNLLAIYIVFKKRCMRSVTNLLLVNMFVGNLLTAVVAMPFSVSYMYLRNLWIGGFVGSMTCKLVHFAYVLPIAASIFALLLSSIDRYLGVVHPFRQCHFIRNAKACTSFIWLSSLMSMSPYLYAFNSELMSDGNSYCLIDWSPLDTHTSSKVFYVTIFLLLYAIPLLVMVFLYLLIGLKLWKRKIPGIVLLNATRAADRSKKKVVKMLVAVVVVFALCWLPAHTTHIIIYVNPELFLLIPTSVKVIAFWACHANSAISPFLFFFLSEKFRTSLFSLFREHPVREKKRTLTMTKIVCMSRNNSASRSSHRSAARPKDLETTLL